MSPEEALQELIDENRRLKGRVNDLTDQLGKYEHVWEEAQSISGRYGAMTPLRAGTVAKALSAARRGRRPDGQPLLAEADENLKVVPRAKYKVAP